ncbi:MAG: hypothetical protein WAV05_12505 [Anaerolineales bacterium]
MPKQRIRSLIPIFVGLMFIAGFFLLLPSRQANAQCGSQVSSCKNCHEVQGEDPVNNDGTAWHTAHAFGDFCYICHGGNSQSTDETTAHTGMVSPLSDIQASCMQCHPSNAQELAQVYATTLGITIGSGTTSTQVSGTPTATETVTTTVVASVPITNVLDVDDANLVNYIQRYNEIVLGEKPINWGNAILIGLICVMAVGGGGFVIMNEKLVKVSFGNTKEVEGEYPADVVELLPSITRINSSSRKTLSNVLNHPKKAEKVLGLMEAVITDEKNEEQP